MSALRGWDGRRAVWVALGLVIALAIGFALYAYVGTLLFAIFLYYATRPFYRALDRRLEHPNVTATVTITAVVLPLVAVAGYAGVLALRELDQFLAASGLGTYRSLLQPYLSIVRERNVDRLRRLLAADGGRSIASILRRGIPSVLERLSTIAGLVFAILARFFLMLTFLFYLLRDDGTLRRWFTRSVDGDEEIVSFLEAVDDDLETVFVGNLAIVGVAAVVAAVAYLGLNLVASSGPVVGTPALLAVLIGVGTLIPAVGMKLVYVPYGLYLFGLAFSTPAPLWQPIAFFALSFTVVDTIPDFFARSLLSARSGVHMGLVLLGYFLGTLAFGWYGLFLGPIVVVAAVHFADRIFPDLASAVLAE
ncbi:AI-2E family transporter [Haloterrigena sp. SYSU A121-1]|uniref:AI-2E family transporter n=1 Tax=Haloterrigena gelatinilytica TaxID=2741724 RepID=A0A8J8KGA8_9EURY|nr:AI-2E family transporter [Haloterrigena gelatinilytica]NUB91857.1 AI-2E family transporter [Haloterrigena gelatinilytica]